VLTRVTSILGGIFLVLSFGLALLNRTSGGTGVESAGRQLQSDVTNDWWQENGGVENINPQPEIQIPESNPETESSGD
jgi:preprotein translocase subunit SecG